MATTGIGPVKQALVRALRANASLIAALADGTTGINEGTNPRGAEYPHIIYNIVYSTRDWDWSGVMLVVEVDVWSVSDSQVEAHNLDQLVNEALEEVILQLEPSSGQTGLLCRRFADLSSVDLDGASNKIYQMGGAYRIWTDQHTA
jgi:hypothetical protein